MSTIICRGWNMIVCFDIGGTAVKSAFAYSATDVRPYTRQPTPLEDFDAFIGCLKTVLDAAPARPEAISVSLAGSVDAVTKRWNIANIPCLNERVIQDELELALDVPLTVSNDADCCAVAESIVGAGRGHEIVFSIILGTGIGGGLVINRRLVNSSGGSAGEWGHGLPVHDFGISINKCASPLFRCGCGLDGCLDATCGARGIERLYRYRVGEELTAQEILDGWLRKEARASQTIESVLSMLSAPLALLVNVTGASIIPAGGGLSKCNPFVSALDTKVKNRTLRKFDTPLVVPAECTTEPGLIGAAIVGFDQM